MIAAQICFSSVPGLPASASIFAPSKIEGCHQLNLKMMGCQQGTAQEDPSLD